MRKKHQSKSSYLEFDDAKPRKWDYPSAFQLAILFLLACLMLVPVVLTLCFIVEKW